MLRCHIECCTVVPFCPTELDENMAQRGKAARAQVPLRIPETLRARIESSAKESSRSMNAEIVKRIERSFERQDLVEEVLEATYGRQLAGLLMILGRSMKDVGAHAGFVATRTVEGGTDWFEVPYAFDQAAQAAETIIEACRPDGEKSIPQKSGIGGVNAMLATLGEGVAATTLSSIAAPEQAPTAELKDWGQKVHDMMGPLVSVIKSRMKSPDKMEEKS